MGNGREKLRYQLNSVSLSLFHLLLCYVCVCVCVCVGAVTSEGKFMLLFSVVGMDREQ